MKIPRTMGLLLPLVALTVTGASDASACGGCFVPPEANTQVTGHRMILSVSTTQSTLWDQIVYSGAPESFAWVLPTKGVVEVGLSSDLLFNTLAFTTDPRVVPPYLNCPSCYAGGDYGTTATATGAGGGAPGGVNVIAQEVVGPYETVQLSATDPSALSLWLSDHGYNLPADIAPIVDAYVAGGFNFLAMKLVPGAGIDSMKPVRITTYGAGVALPLRMVAAGTGAVTPITLWVVGEGRYAPTNFDQFVISETDVVWNWDTSDSNYAALKQQGFAAKAGHTWLIESASPTSQFSIEGTVMGVVQNLPEQSGYGAPDGTGAYDEAVADLETLYGTVDMSSMWLTRMHAELPRSALAADLFVGASADQSPVPNVLYVTKTTGTATCPPDPCGGGLGGAPGSFFSLSPDGTGGGLAPKGGCAMGASAGDMSLPAGAIAIALSIAFSRRRRRA